MKRRRAFFCTVLVSAHAGPLLLSRLAKGAIGADQRRVARLWWLQATVLDAALEGAKGLQLRDRARPILSLHQADMDEGIVLQAQRQVAHAGRGLGLEVLKDLGNELSVDFGGLGFRLVAHDNAFHGNPCSFCPRPSRALKTLRRYERIPIEFF